MLTIVEKEIIYVINYGKHLYEIGGRICIHGKGLGNRK